MNVGKLSESILKRSVLKYVQPNSIACDSTFRLEQGAKIGADCALFAVSDKDKFDKDKDKLAVASGVSVGRNRRVVAEALINACNNLACSGAKAIGAQITLTLPEAVFESELKHMMEEAAAFAAAHQVDILGGHTMVNAGVTEPVAAVTVIGHSSDFEAKQVKPGMDVVMSKWIGLQGTAKIASIKEEELLKRLPKRMIREAATFDTYMSIVPEARIAAEHGVCAMHDVSGGGIFRALWELSEAAEGGIRIELKKIPIRQETVEVCEVFGLNPYELLSGGALLMVTEHGDRLVEALAEAGIFAEVIGVITDNNDRVLVTHCAESDEIRFLERPKTDEIDKL